jgi:hypothetical protein
MEGKGRRPLPLHNNKYSNHLKNSPTAGRTLQIVKRTFNVTCESRKIVYDASGNICARLQKAVLNTVVFILYSLNVKAYGFIPNIKKSGIETE